MFCPNCGKEIKNPKAFCPACGTSLEKYKAAFSQEMTDQEQDAEGTTEFEENDNLEPEETYNKTVGESDDEPEEKTHKAYISEDVPARAGKHAKKKKSGFPKALLLIPVAAIVAMFVYTQFDFSGNKNSTDVAKNINLEKSSGDGSEKGQASVAEPTAMLEPTATLVPTATPEPTATLAPTATPEPTATPVPTATPAPTATPVPTATPEPTKVLLPTATPSPTPGAEPAPADNQPQAATEPSANAGATALRSDFYKDGQITGTDPDYIIPDSLNRYLTAEDLSNLSAKGLCFARNEMLARMGRGFNNHELQDYFNSMSWYQCTMNPSDFDNSVQIPDVVSANAALMKSLEEPMGMYIPWK